MIHIDEHSTRTRPVPRTLHEAFGPYAELDVGHPPKPHKGDVLVGVVSALILAGLLIVALFGR